MSNNEIFTLRIVILKKELFAKNTICNLKIIKLHVKIIIM